MGFPYSSVGKESACSAGDLASIPGSGRSPGERFPGERNRPTLCNPMYYIVYGILLARILEWVAIPSPGDLPNPGIKPGSPALQADSLPSEPPGKPQ